MTKRTRNARAGSIMFVAVVLLLACAPSARSQTYFCCTNLGTGWVQCGNGDWCQFTYCVGGYPWSDARAKRGDMRRAPRRG